MTWHNLHITDKTGKKFFNTDASPMSTMSEIRNLQRHVEAIKASAKGYEFADSAMFELVKHSASWNDFVADNGEHEEYDAQDVLAWLRY